uniref:Uncharacterized protein n=1 Tax=viral metagenome TaxID=1070528 RepID=A0A6M3JM51_9ZZZZ
MKVILTTRCGCRREMDFGWSIDELPPCIDLPLQKDYNYMLYLDDRISDMKTDIRRFKYIARGPYTAFYCEEIVS